MTVTSTRLRALLLLTVGAVVAALLVVARPGTAEAADGERLWRSVDSESLRSCAIRKSPQPRLDRGLYCWGDNSFGGTGTGRPEGSIPVSRVGSGQWRSVEVGNDHSCGIGMSDTLYCWGLGARGRLGDGRGDFATRTTPFALDGRWTAVSAGLQHTCGIGRSGALYCWGGNDQGQLGDGTKATRTRPVAVGTRSDWVAVDAGGNHTCATKRDGRLFCWGSDEDDMIGGGGSTTTPRQVAEGATAPSLSTSSSCFLAGGARTCTGDNPFGNLGDGTREGVPEFTRIGSSLFRAHSASDYFGCGVESDRELRCWGTNGVGRLGDGTRTDRLQPTRVGIRSDWSTVAAGLDHACAVKVDGRLYCWGSNAQLQTGATGRGPFLSPRLVR